MSNAQTSRVLITDLAAMKVAGKKWAMLTCYEQITAEIFVDCTGDSTLATAAGAAAIIRANIDSRNGNRSRGIGHEFHEGRIRVSAIATARAER